MAWVFLSESHIRAHSKMMEGVNLLTLDSGGFCDVTVRVSEHSMMIPFSEISIFIMFGACQTIVSKVLHIIHFYNERNTSTMIFYSIFLIFCMWSLMVLLQFLIIYGNHRKCNYFKCTLLSQYISIFVIIVSLVEKESKQII